jgi:hypothetical protein
MNYQFVFALLLTAFSEQTTASLTRITISYRALELGLAPLWIGIITAAFAVVPLVLTVQVGRYIDRGHDAETAWVGGAVMTAACAGLVFFKSLPALLLFTALLGTGHLLLVISQQVLCSRQAGRAGMERMIGNYMVANALGQGVGPWIVGWVGGAASVPPTTLSS